MPKEFAEGGAAVALNYSADKEKSGSQRQAITACVTRLPVKRCAKDANNRTKSRVREGSFLWDDHRIRILGFTMIGGTYTICITFFMRLVVKALTHLFRMLSSYQMGVAITVCERSGQRSNDGRA